MKSLFGLEGKRILVLGGGLGIGEATTRLLAEVGCNVAIADRELDRAERVAAELGGKVEAMPIAVDVLDDAGLVASIATVERDFGPLDGMVTVIGMAAWASLLDTDFKTWDIDHRRNLRFFFVAAREVARSMIARGSGGSIACVGSMDGARAAPYHGSYGAAKAGLSNLVKTMSNEWGPHGVRANVVAPGAIITPRVPHMGENEAKYFSNIPLQRRGTPEDIASALVFLLSDMASYITGETLGVDGGILAAYPFDLGAQAAPKPTAD